MFIAHIPAGYILSKLVIQRDAIYKRSLLGVALVCSVLPDVDLAYFYLVDLRRHAHHDYVTHTPIFWLVMAGLLTVGLVACRKTARLIFVGIGLLSILLHLALDTVAADIRWLYPFSDRGVNLVQVPAVYQPWYLNFVFHWTSWIELAICLLAIVLFTRDRFQKRLQWKHSAQPVE
ncbi:metal-dependent hydrolase [Rhizobium leucaenae]|uniref:Inner membrane protein n=1 Tax=Rhizobium leucaenae TaxID=29450 RepID=A0A7W6ZW29_9HYPH|nr:metal-dependent hydrolase [Rhizobium leucaenae]MBB4569828.1 inner membrane protein [Rhizobium leucaenae]MBB6299659.1 inner membrane protein [Rhizobium leucaenae]